MKLRSRHLNCNIKSRKKNQGCIFSTSFMLLAKLLMFNWLLGENATYAVALIMIPLEPYQSSCHINPSEWNPVPLNFSPSFMYLSSYDIKHVSMETKSISFRRQQVNNSCLILSLFFRDYFITSEKASTAVCTLQQNSLITSIRLNQQPLRTILLTS